MTNICILRSNPVNPDSRVEKEANSLQKNGYNVTIFAWDRDDNYKIKKEALDINSNITVYRTGIKASYGEGFKNIKQFIIFQYRMVVFLIKNRFDVIHACDFDTAYVSAKIAKIEREKFIFDIFDFICGEPSDVFQKIVKKKELNIINMADATIICTEERRRQIEGSKPKKLTVIHNAPSLDQVDRIEKKNYEIDSKIKICYVGVLQPKRLLIEISEYFIENNNIELHIGGFGMYENYFNEISKKYSNIKYYGKLTYRNTLALEKQCDIMLAIYDPSVENHKYAAPNKFYEGLFLGKPLIMVKNTGMSNVVEENRIGETIVYSKEGFEKGLIKILNRKKEWESIKEKELKLFNKKYNWNIMEKKLITLYRNL